LAEAGDDGLWLFAYGSLLWRPDFPHNGSRIARIHGYHRRFCLWQWRWRGSDAAPNLMLALAPGGCCTGLAYRIEGPGLREKLGPVWRREMAGDGYRPRWLSAVTEAGPLRIAAFVANRRGDRYAGRLPDDRVAAIIAWARGHGGTGAEYLLKTTLAMEALGERDHMLWRMQRLVAENLK
jgi:cation transport protein ChaC